MYHVNTIVGGKWSFTSYGNKIWPETLLYYSCSVVCSLNMYDDGNESFEGTMGVIGSREGDLHGCVLGITSKFKFT